MKIPSFKAPTLADFPNMDEENYDALKVLSDQLQLLTQCLQANVSPEDNGNVEMRTLTLEDGVAMKIQLNSLRGVPQEVTVVRHNAFATDTIAWEVVDQDEIRVKVSFTPASDTVTIPDTGVSTTLMIRGPGDE